MYPEAGGSSLFARRAFNELWSFFTAWAQMLNYIITIAISAFFAAALRRARSSWDGFKELAVGHRLSRRSSSRCWRSSTCAASRTR